MYQNYCIKNRIDENENKIGSIFDLLGLCIALATWELYWDLESRESAGENNYNDDDDDDDDDNYYDDSSMNKKIGMCLEDRAA